MHAYVVNHTLFLQFIYDLQMHAPHTKKIMPEILYLNTNLIQTYSSIAQALDQKQVSMLRLVNCTQIFKKNDF